MRKKVISKNLEIRINQNKGSRSSNRSVQIRLIDFENRFAYALLEYVKRFRNFRYSIYIFFVNIYRMLKSNNELLVTIEFPHFGLLIKSIDFVNSELNRFKQRLEINFVGLKENDQIIRAWTSIVNSWLIKKTKYDTHWAYLSTFGGAYSSLGESSKEAAINAEVISKKQLLLALAFNDPNAICRCKLFLGFSYIQQEKFAEAKLILRKEYKYLRDPESSKAITDHKLLVMCVAGLKKLRASKELNNLRVDCLNGERQRS